MALLLFAACTEELEAILKPIVPNLNVESQKLMALTPTIRKFGKIFAVCTGVGPINAALALGQAIQGLISAKINVDHILVAGLAGAFNLDVNPLRSMCVVTEEIWPEYGLNDGHEVIAEAFRWPQWDDSPQGTIYNRVKLANLETFNLKTAHLNQFTLVKSLSVAGFSASFNRARDLWDKFHAELENMEGFAIAFGALRHNIPCTEIRSISNKTGPRSKAEMDFQGALAQLEHLLPTLELI